MSKIPAPFIKRSAPRSTTTPCDAPLHRPTNAKCAAVNEKQWRFEDEGGTTATVCGTCLEQRAKPQASKPLRTLRGRGRYWTGVGAVRARELGPPTLRLSSLHVERRGATFRGRTEDRGRLAHNESSARPTAAAVVGGVDGGVGAEMNYPSRLCFRRRVACSRGCRCPRLLDPSSSPETKPHIKVSFRVRKRLFQPYGDSPVPAVQGSPTSAFRVSSRGTCQLGPDKAKMSMFHGWKNTKGGFPNISTCPVAHQSGNSAAEDSKKDGEGFLIMEHVGPLPKKKAAAEGSQKSARKNGSAGHPNPSESRLCREVWRDSRGENGHSQPDSVQVFSLRWSQSRPAAPGA
ncbi:hypothetical protein BDK51DRAFT_47022 [Blyttiomyces helicus]|uniref:Uncharacterized protein n=1 Tax=Blyttiomyces helicus TaxID=388810 RepID=A0A4P9WDL4_9FUNG|nr:hypothetical protein BDK51DRAFT_47022 [Blyttiomyces helicus]|eukprot:RKO89763.1 hypothetical protein BDK51DRAFT_47022 [Blyttiomyces helicus]